MSTLRKIYAGFGLALVTALASVAGSASATETANSEPAGLRCTVSANNFTGREWAKLVIIRERNGEVICSRVRTGGEAPADYPSCYQRRDELGCTIIVD